MFNPQDNVTFDDNNPSNTAGNYSVTLNTTVSPGSVTVNNSLGNYTISGTGTIGGTGSLTKSGTGMLTLSTANNYSGGTIVTAGKLLIEPTSSTTSALPTGALSISGNGIVQLADNVTAGTPFGHQQREPHIAVAQRQRHAGHRQQSDHHRLQQPRDRPDRFDRRVDRKRLLTKPGRSSQIISSDIAADDAASGCSMASVTPTAPMGWSPGLPSGEIEIMFTLLGDANLDGQVNAEDFTPFSANVGKNGSWDDGDFNYDGTVNSEDFTPFSADLGQSATLAAASRHIGVSGWHQSGERAGTGIDGCPDIGSSAESQIRSADRTANAQT